MTDSPLKSPGRVAPPMELSPDLEIEYVNMVRISHSISELVFDFARLLPGEGKAHISSRIIMSPLSAKLFFRALSDNLSKFESVFGPINLPGDPTLADNLFHPYNSPEKPPEAPQEE
ncbi:MAG: hypothetical protein A2Z16_09390 [Chloroflexi bacterium RBG_16_54_18]|nr:MAG: hypothetical protein A2Z16_09390 [Chloroflexi bacterium RBG_16_54_18]